MEEYILNAINSFYERFNDLENRIEKLERTTVKCCCPPWYLKYLETYSDKSVDTLYIRNAGWSCPLHGNITT